MRRMIISQKKQLVNSSATTTTLTTATTTTATKTIIFKSITTKTENIFNIFFFQQGTSYGRSCRRHLEGAHSAGNQKF